MSARRARGRAVLAKFLLAARPAQKASHTFIPFAIKNAIARELESVAVLRVDEGRGEIVHEVTFDPGALRGKVREVGGTLKDRALGEAEVYLGLEEEGPRHEDTFGDDNCASAISGELIDSALDGLGVDGGIVGDRAGFGNEQLSSGRG